jgi:hypothetical protein
MNTNSPARLSDRDLLAETIRAVARESRTTAELLSLLAELDLRKLYLGEGYTSLFAYCTQALHLSEPAAYSRITAARAARRFPVILTLLADGAVTLTTVGQLAAHLTDENHEALLGAARHKSKREVEHLVACLHPQPDIPSSIRRLAVPAERPSPEAVDGPLALTTSAPAADARAAHSATSAPPSAPASRPLIAPLAPERFLIRITVSSETHRKLSRARDLLRHTIPNGDPAAIVDRALTVLVEQLERTKTSAVRRPRPESGTMSRARHVPAAVRRAVWARDGGQCAFVGTSGRCTETGFLEFHHVVPFAAGGVTTTENLQLRCRSHNAYEAGCYFEGRAFLLDPGVEARGGLCPDGVSGSDSV